MFGLRLHFLHEPWTLDDVTESGIILHVGSRGELAARLNPLNHNGPESRARGVDGSGQAGGA